MKEEILKAVEVLKRGGVILYPTDTVWGFGCDATRSDAVERLNMIKGSVGKNGMIVLTDTIDSVGRYFRRIPSVAWELLECAEKPLTLIMPDGVGVASELIAEGGTLAIRVPKHDFCRDLIYRLGRAIVSTSANFSGEKTPTKYGDIDPELIAKVDFVVSPAFEGAPTRKASSIIELGAENEIKEYRKLHYGLGCEASDGGLGYGASLGGQEGPGRSTDKPSPADV